MVFNIVGYRAWFYFAEKQSDTKMEAMLNNNRYDENDLVELRIPLNMPYQQEIARFERVNGEVSFNGRIYKYVKRKVSNGVLIVLCLPDQKKMQIREVKTQYGNFANDLSDTSGKASQKTASHITHTFSDYEAFLYQVNVPELTESQKSLSPAAASQLADCLIASPGKPPKAML
jgi:hypothetical protein